MTQNVLIGLGAGAAAALLFASQASGSLFALFLVYLSPLPILIAAIGWNYVAGLTAVLSAALSLLLIFGAFVSLGFLFGVAIPAWWLGYLALLARPSSDGSIPETLEWYPVGRLVIWAAAIAALVVAVQIPFLGTDAASFQAALQAEIEKIFAFADFTIQEPERGVVLEALTRALPAVAASGGTIMLLFNLWLAARIVKVSGRLKRPWPDLSGMRLPRLAPIFLAASFAGIFLPGLLSIISDIFAAALLMAFALLGFAVLHAVTRGTTGRPLVLGGVYALVVVLKLWPAFTLAPLLGLIDAAVDLRGRIARTRAPPPTLH